MLIYEWGGPYAGQTGRDISENFTVRILLESSSDIGKRQPHPPHPFTVIHALITSILESNSGFLDLVFIRYGLRIIQYELRPLRDCNL